MTELANSLIGELRTCGEKLPMSLRERIVSEGPALIPTLIDILREEEANNDDDWSSIHIVDLLADLKAEDAIQPMLRVLAETDWDFIIHDRIILRLPELGAHVLEPALSMLAEGPPDDVAESLCAIVSQLGVRDERVFKHLASRFSECPDMASGWLADYGDTRGIAIIEEAIRSFDPDANAEFGPIVLRDFVEAYERLAGTLPEDLQAHVDVCMAVWDAERTPPPPAAQAARSNKIGRNDPCPCGSGKKYKRCHLGADSEP